MDRDKTGGQGRIAHTAPANFVGRADTLRELQGRILEQSPTVVGLRGTAGVGKTALALVLARQLTGLYPDAQIFVDWPAAAQPPAHATVMGQVIHAFNPLARLPHDDQSLQAAYRQALSGRRALLFFDNIGSADELGQLLPPAGCLLLFTAGERLGSRGLNALRLAGLPLADARRLLLSLAPRIGQHADKLAALCGQMPLALQLVGRGLAAGAEREPNEYAQRLEAVRGRSGAATEAEAVIALNYSLMPAELQQCWRHLAVFPADFDRQAAGAVWALGAAAAGKVLDSLLNYGLVEQQPALRRYRLHDVVRRAANARLEGQERQAARLRHATYYAALLGAVDDLYRKGGHSLVRGLRLFDLERNNLLAGQAWVSSGADKDDSLARLANQYGGVGGANVLSQRLPLAGQKTWFETASQAARRLADRRAETEHLSKLGSVYRHLGQPRQAAKYYEQCLWLARALSDRQLEAVALDKLGLAWADMGHPRRAAEFYEQSLCIAREIGHPSDEARTSWNLGLAYKELDDLPAAIAAMQVCVNFERQIGHPNAEADAAELDWLRARLAGRGHR